MSFTAKVTCSLTLLWYVVKLGFSHGGESRRSWIEETFSRRECLKFIPSTRDLHRCCCGRLMGEHSWQDAGPPMSMIPGPGQEVEEEHWSTERHTRARPTDAYGTIDFQDSDARVCRAKYVRVAVDSKAEAVLQLMLREWQMDRPKLLISVQGGSENLILPPKVSQAFSKGLITAALSTGAWILTDGINTGVSRYVGEAVKTFGSPNLRKRNTVGVTPWGMINNNNNDLIGRDVYRPYQPLGNPLSKTAFLNNFHSHFLLVDDGTMGKYGCQQGFRRRLEKHIQLQRIHPRLNLGVPVVCVVVEGGPAMVSTVLDYVSSEPPVPVFVFEGSGRAADLLAFLHKQTAMDRQLDADLQDDFLDKIGHEFGVDRPEASDIFGLLMNCMDYRLSITIFDSESEDQQATDSAILTSILKGTNASPAEQLSMALAWDRADIAKEQILVYGQHCQRDSLYQAMLDALVMDRVAFVQLLIDHGMTMSSFLTVERLEELYNTSSVPRGYRLTVVDMGMVVEYLIGGAYRSTYTRKHFRAAYNLLQIQNKEKARGSVGFLSKHRRVLTSNPVRSPQRPHFFRTAQPYKRKERDSSLPGNREAMASATPAGDVTLLGHFNFNDLFVWAVLQRRQQMALFLWQHGEEALARATVACKIYRSMASEARQSNMDDNVAEQLKAYSLEFGQLSVDMLDCAFHQNEQMAMKLLTSEMEDWSHFTCLQMAVSSGHRPFVSHSCTQTLLTDLWTGSLNMRKNSFLKIILSLVIPPAILLLEFKSQAEMCHVPQSQEAPLFGRDPGKPDDERTERKDVEGGLSYSQSCLGLLSGTFSSLTRRCLFWIRRFYECYTAPVVKFWFHTISYLLFLMLFSYTVLVKMEDYPSIQEWLVIAYILSTAVEKTREVLMSEPRKLSQKLKIWFSEYWNVSDFIAIVLFMAGLTLRWHTDTYKVAGRISYCLDIIFWFVRVLDLLAVNQHAGPYLTMITKMTSNMFFIVVMMAIVLLSFGVSRKAILSPNEKPSWTLAVDVVFQPYWMIFGEAVYLFFQYIIMVNILIAFFNNVYFDMASTSNKLWKYNRYRYIMTYQDRPWLPPPFILLSHMALCVSALWRRLRGGTKGRGSGLKLYLCQEDRKRLHEFEEKCVHVHFHQKNKGLHSNQTTQIRATAERTEEMSTVVGEVSERVHSIQDSLLALDGQLGQLQDLSALAVDTLNLLSASDSLQRQDAWLAPYRQIALAHQPLPHSWTLRCGGCDVTSVRRVASKACKSTPPSLLRGTSRLALPPESHTAGRRNRSPGHTERATGEKSPSAAELPQGGHEFAPLDYFPSGGINGGLWGRTPCDSQEPSRCRSPPPPPGSGGDGEPEQHHGGHRSRSCDLSLYPSQEHTSMEEAAEEEEEEEKDDKDEIWVEHSDPGCDPHCVLSRASSGSRLPSDRRDSPSFTKSLVNPAFSQDSGQRRCRPLPSSQRAKVQRKPFQWACVSRERPYRHCRSLSSSVENITFGAPLSPLRGSLSFLAGPLSGETSPGGRVRHVGASLRGSRSEEWSKSSDFGLLMGSKAKGLNKKTVKIQEGESQSVSVEQLCQIFVTMERNNLMRLAHTIPFTTAPTMGGEEVSVYSLEEVPSDGSAPASGTTFCWSSQGLSAVLQRLYSEEGSLDGGLCLGTRVLCTWAEREVLLPGSVYVVKAFRPEVVRVWQRHFQGSTALQLCLREIQQQIAAQKMMEVFNKVKPEGMHHCPGFLDVSLVLWHATGQWQTIERYMPGNFRKYNNNTGDEITPCCSLEETLLAFSHWTYEYSRKELLVLDIQGVGENLTDPSVIRAEDQSYDAVGGEMLFGPDNLGNAAINRFLLNHACNVSCRKLGLSELRRRSDAREIGGDP
ncbi:Transient receptor potential cation channel subfamily M member 6 [Merluccius polli]|uniref:non-specific serine/threonine protein kinase n=1 Tax=Merluccius polli TaxID=89951 RepID=A0AA47MC79_MERPO|nr:Transient receptor potential cation channel subfamily M member 6 [Merluccius polli]